MLSVSANKPQFSIRLHGGTRVELNIPSNLQDRIPGEAFVAKPTKEAEMEKILRSMEVFYYRV